jgi:fructokinase
VRPLRIGIDLGGTKIEGILLDADGSEAARHRIPAPRDDYAASSAGPQSIVSTQPRRPQ